MIVYPDNQHTTNPLTYFVKQKSGASILSPVIATSQVNEPSREQVASLPVEFKVEQNYPNPFNSSTVIGFQLPGESWVTLKVYNVFGQEVARLVNEELPAGSYKRVFDAGGLAC